MKTETKIRNTPQETLWNNFKNAFHEPFTFGNNINLTVLFMLKTWMLQSDVWIPDPSNVFSIPTELVGQVYIDCGHKLYIRSLVLLISSIVLVKTQPQIKNLFPCFMN